MLPLSARNKPSAEVLGYLFEHARLVPPAFFASLIEAISDRLERAESVVVHCGAGWGRAGLVAALVLVAHGTTVPEALDQVRAARPAAGPQSEEQHQQLARLAPRVFDQITAG